MTATKTIRRANYEHLATSDFIGASMSSAQMLIHVTAALADKGLNDAPAVRELEFMCARQIWTRPD